MIIRLRIEEDLVDKIREMSTKKKFSGVVLKPTDNNFKNQNRNGNKAKNTDCNKNWNPQKVQYLKSPAKNDSDNLIICFKCGKLGHLAH
ncbi:hypothetical protein Lal_00014700, partial [Lupinus albus]